MAAGAFKVWFSTDDGIVSTTFGSNEELGAFVREAANGGVWIDSEQGLRVLIGPDTVFTTNPGDL